MLIVTVRINEEDKNYSNIILWKYENITIGRFENIYDKPMNEDSFLKKPLKVIYDSNYNKLDFNNNKSYTFTSYNSTDPPANKKCIKINKLSFEMINKFKISLYHHEGPMEPENEQKPEQNELSNVRKLYTTCSWGDCVDYNTYLFH